MHRAAWTVVLLALLCDSVAKAASIRTGDGLQLDVANTGPMLSALSIDSARLPGGSGGFSVIDYHASIFSMSFFVRVFFNCVCDRSKQKLAAKR